MQSGIAGNPNRKHYELYADLYRTIPGVIGLESSCTSRIANTNFTYSADGRNLAKDGDV
jgi:hypothetical protein